MGVTILNALSIIESWRDGARFDATLTLGRLDCVMTAPDLRRIARLLPEDSVFARAIARAEPPKYMDDLFRAMGAATVDAMDASDFEGASIIHDLNEPLPVSLRSRFDAVVDTGTLEHLFNVPTAFKNAMDALKIGGSFLAMLPANNWCGHGFYQFSAEFFFRTFSPDNGFEMRKLLIAPAYLGGRWVDGPAFEVCDPRQMRDRVQVVSKQETVFLVHARKMSEGTVFATWPQQSDYVEAWKPTAFRTSRPQGAVAAVPSYLRRIGRLNKIGGIRRAIVRMSSKRLWTHRCRRNPALTAHDWIDER